MGVIEQHIFIALWIDVDPAQYGAVPTQNGHDLAAVRLDHSGARRTVVERLAADFVTGLTHKRIIVFQNAQIPIRIFNNQTVTRVAHDLRAVVQDRPDSHGTDADKQGFLELAQPVVVILFGLRIGFGRGVTGDGRRKFFIRRARVFFGDLFYHNVGLGFTAVSSGGGFGSSGCISGALFLTGFFRSLFGGKISGDLLFRLLLGFGLGLRFSVGRAVCRHVGLGLGFFGRLSLCRLCLSLRLCLYASIAFSGRGICLCLGRLRFRAVRGFGSRSGVLLCLGFGCSLGFSVCGDLCSDRILTLCFGLRFGGSSFLCLGGLCVCSGLSFGGLLFSGLRGGGGFCIGCSLRLSSFCFSGSGGGLCVGSGLLFRGGLGFCGGSGFGLGGGGGLLFRGVYGFSGGFCIGRGLRVGLGFRLKTKSLRQIAIGTQCHHLIRIRHDTAVRQHAWEHGLLPFGHAAFCCLGKTTCGQSQRQTHGQRGRRFQKFIHS